MVESMLNYLAPMSERPVYWLTEPPKGMRWRNTKGDRRVLPIRDARALELAPSLDREGFALVHHETAALNLYDPDSARTVYYPEVEKLVAGVTGARRVLAFDHNVRNPQKAERGEDGAQAPVRFAAEELLTRRFSVINVWKPIRGPVEETPLAFCDAQTMKQDDFVETSLEYADRTGEVYSLRFDPAHRWYYYPAMRADEVMLLKCYDSATGVARFTAHSAIDDPTSFEGAKPRESIEVRTLAFF